jgi:signal transduction histidine kinase
MVISVLFSFVLYWALSSELRINVGGQVGFLQGSPPPRPFIGGNAVDEERRAQFEQLRKQQISDSTKRVRERLVLFNLLIFLVGSGTSYLLARRTLHPIKNALDAQSRFTADASHELRTPLAAMKVEIETALRDLRTPDRPVLKSALEEIGKLEALSGQLLELADYENQSAQRPTSEVKIIDVFNDVQAKMKGLAKRRNIKLTFQVADESVRANPDALRELVVILVDNAIKYSPDDTTVNITSKVADNQVRIEVRDCGIGIKSSHIPHLFERFYRADSSRSGRNVPGHGLGLSVAQKIVESHKGRIEVESAPGKGSTFRVILPTGSTSLSRSG